MTKRFARAVTVVYLNTAAFIAVLGIATTLLGLFMLTTGWAPQ